APDRTTGVYAAGGALAALLIFGSLALHEGGHWLMAHRAGLPVVRLVLSLVGGSLELGAAPRSPAMELRLALGGPVASLVAPAPAACWASRSCSSPSSPPPPVTRPPRSGRAPSP